MRASSTSPGCSTGWGWGGRRSSAASGPTSAPDPATKTESAPVLTVNRPSEVRFGTVGKPLENVEIRIAPDGGGGDLSTLTIQSEVFFEAVRGSGGTARLVLLPFEDHGYRAVESIEHVLWEQLRWFDTYVKNAAPRGSD